jgi:hypothetical protein
MIDFTLILGMNVEVARLTVRSRYRADIVVRSLPWGAE